MRAPDPESVKAAADRAEARAGGKSDRRTGRGHLTSFDLLPEEAREDVAWAVAELNARQRTQDDIRVEFNARLALKGVDPISRSAFNRTSIRLASMSARLDEARKIFEGVAPQFTPERVDENTVAIGEFIKLLLFELVQAEGSDIGPKGAMELARAHLAVIQGQKISADRRRSLQAEFKAEAAKALDKVAKTKGLTADAVLAVKAELFGQVAPAETARGT